jgi:hypothetical protein
VTGLERLQASTVELKQALDQALAEIPAPPDNTGDIQYLESLTNYLNDSSYKFSVIHLLLSVVDTIQSLRKANRWYDFGFRKAGIVTKDTAKFKFAGESKCM